MDKEEREDMSIWYVGFKKIGNENKILFSTQTKSLIEKFLTKDPKNEYSHWDITESGPIPSGILTDNRTYKEKRKAGYKAESDKYLMEAHGNLFDGEDKDKVFEEWKVVRESIKKKYPKI